LDFSEWTQQFNYMEIINLITHINKIGMKIILLFVSIFLMLGC